MIILLRKSYFASHKRLGYNYFDPKMLKKLHLTQNKSCNGIRYIEIWRNRLLCFWQLRWAEQCGNTPRPLPSKPMHGLERQKMVQILFYLKNLKICKKWLTKNGWSRCKEIFFRRMKCFALKRTRKDETKCFCYKRTTNVGYISSLEEPGQAEQSGAWQKQHRARVLLWNCQNLAKNVNFTK